ncbi:MAG: ATP-binding protein [Gammaproteobacteria bacterium]|nr:ATP-binding protein [Gammaproteobacteria bacterium]
MKYSSKSISTFVVAVPLLLAGLIILAHDVQDHSHKNDILDVVLLVCGFFLSILFYLYLKHLSQTTEQMRKAIRNFESSGDEGELPIHRDDELGELGRSIAGIFRQEKKQIKDLEESEAKLAALFEVVKEGIVIADEDGFMRDVNPSLCSMLGYEPTELIGKNVSMLMPAPYSVHHDQYMHHAVESGSMGFMGMYRDLKAQRKDGTSFAVELSLDKLSFSEHKYFAATMRDVSEQREHERQLTSAKIKAEIANEAKSNFLSMMSHEIRTPLHAVMGMLDLLAVEIQNGEHKDLITIANKSAVDLLHIVDDLLDMSKVESGQIELEESSFELSHLLQESVKLYFSQATGKGLKLEFDLLEELPSSLVGDAHRLRQVINNLLSNAIKFTHTGSISMTSSWRELNADRIEVSITIADTGIGISAGKLDTVFEPFIQEDNSISREFGGTGLGLSIVKHLVERMQGQITLESIRGEGSRFSMSIPFLKSNEVMQDAVTWLQDRDVVCVDVEDEDLLRYMQRHGAHIKQIIRSQFMLDIEGQGLKGSLIVCGESDVDTVENINEWLKIAAPTEHLLLIQDAEERRESDFDERVLMVRRPLLPMSLDSIFRYLYDLEQTAKIPVSTLGGEMKKILLVEDNPVNQMVAQAMLEKMGYEVVVAVNGQVGVDVMKSQPIDLVLMDLHMPVMDGYEATRQIREFMDGHVPILAMTADAGMADKENCLAAGMDDHLPKPIKMDVLQQVLQGWLAPQV